MKDSREIIQKPIADRIELELPFESPIVSPTGRYQAYREIGNQEGFQLVDYWRAIRKRLWLGSRNRGFGDHARRRLYGSKAEYLSG
jgi:hypothetical protein